jgi:uncharacterized protein YcfJ
MKNTIRISLSLLTLAASAAGSVAMAQEQGRVISTTPVISQVAVPRQVCTQEQVVTQSNSKSGAGALIGGVAGGAVGNAIGNGSGRAAATMIGIFGGAILGDRIEGGQQQANTQNVQRCTTQTFYENRPTAYNVVYEFNGKQYQVQMPQDPGPFVQLSVTPVTAPAPIQVQPAPVVIRPVTQAPVYTQPVIVETSTVYVQPAPVYSYQAPVYFAPVVVRQPYYHHGYRPYYNPGSSVSIGYYRHFR